MNRALFKCVLKVIIILLVLSGAKIRNYEMITYIKQIKKNPHAPNNAWGFAGNHQLFYSILIFGTSIPS